MKYTLYTFHHSLSHLIIHEALKPIRAKVFNFLINSLKRSFIPKNKIFKLGFSYERIGID